MKEITDITPDGITYVDEEGNQQFIDFETCHQNKVMEVKHYKGSRWTDKDEEIWQSMKYVGKRFALSDPPALEFYTIPRIHFEFSTIESLTEILVGIRNAGWRTNDGE